MAKAKSKSKTGPLNPYFLVYVVAGSLSALLIVIMALLCAFSISI